MYIKSGQLFPKEIQLWIFRSMIIQDKFLIRLSRTAIDTCFVPPNLAHTHVYNARVENDQQCLTTDLVMTDTWAQSACIYTRKNVEVVAGLQTSCYKSAHKLSTSYCNTFTTSCYQLVTSLMAYLVIVVGYCGTPFLSSYDRLVL